MKNKLLAILFVSVLMSISWSGYSQCSANAGIDTIICQNTPLIRTATVTPSGATIQWYLQGNSTNILSTTATLNTIPTIADTFFYIIKVTSGSGSTACTDLDTFRVIVRPSPRVSAGSNQTVCQQSPLSISASVNPSTATVNWYQLGSTTSLGTSSTFNVPTTTAGTFDYVIKADSASTCSDKDTVRVIVNPKPVAAFTFSSNCGRNYSFTSTSTTSGGTITDYCWNFGTGNGCQSTSQNPNFRFPRGSSGQTFTVKLIITNSFGCKDTVTQNITIGVSPFAELASDQQTTVINGEEYFYVCASGSSELIFYNNSQNYLATSTYQLNWGDGSPLENYNQTTFPAPLSSNVTQSHFYSPGTYNLSFSINNGGCIDSTRYKIFVGSIPAGGLTRNQSQTICTDNPETVNIQNTSSNTPGTIYTLTFNDGSSPITLVAPISDPYPVTHVFDTSSCGTNSTNGSINYNNAFGAYLTVQNPCGSTSSAVVPIFVASKPEADFTITPYDSICVGQIITLTNTGNAGQNVDASTQTCIPGKVVWQINPSTPGTRFQLQAGSNLGLIQTAQVNNWVSGTDIVNIRFDSAGIYTIRQITANAASCSGRDTVIKTICVNPLPTASFSISPDIDCAPLRVNANGSTNIPTCGQNTYQWGVSYVPISGCTPASSDYAYVDGTSATSQNPHFNFVNPGLYIISLQTLAPNARCSSTVVKDTVTVKGKPVVSLNLTDNTVCVNEPITPTNTSTCFIDASTTYAWSFQNGTPATSSSTSPGPITYTTSGTYNIGLNVTNSCGVTPASASVTVNPLPTITGTASICVGANTQLSGSATPSATNPWASSNTAIATVSSTGLVTGVATGTAVITYTNNNDCSQTITVTVNALPTITGNAAICVGSSLTLTGSATAATTNPWSSSNTGIATITSGGVVTAVSGGSSTITYTNSNGCQTTETFVVNALPTITGNTTICLGSTSQLTGSGTAAASNPWTSSTPAVATVSAGGLVTAVSVGTTTITYTDNNGCVKTTTVTVKPLPTITGSASICVGSNVSFSGTGNPSATTPWTSSNTNVVTVNNSGSVTGVAAGTATITYTDEFGCQATLLVTVSSSPTATISYPTSVCTNQTNQNVTLTGATGGTFSVSPVGTTGLSLNTSTGAINPSTSTAGTYTVNYNLPAGNGCSAVNVNTTVTITNTPAAPTVTSPLVYCQNATAVALTATATGTNSLLYYTVSTGGTGSTTLIPSTATAGSTTYYVSQVTANGCEGPRTPITVTVNALPTITGNAAICVGSSLTLTGSATAATTNPWSSSNTGVATITNAGVVTAVSGGSSTITYTNSNGCQTTETFVVNALPTITGNTTICLGSTSQLTGSGTAAASNPWTSSTPAVATVSAGGLVTAVSVGTTTITYTDNNGCVKTTTVTVKPLPTITGSASICVGSNVSFTGTGNPSATTPWTSSNTNVVTVNNSGSVTGVAAGTATITYTDEFGCQATLLVTVSSSPTATISYPTSVCTNQTNQNVTLTGATGGTFSVSPAGTTGLSLNTSTGAINPSTSNAGTYTVNYNLPAANGCPAVNVDTNVTITNTPAAPVASGNNICSGNTLQLNTSYTGSGTPTWNWTGPNGFSSADEDPTIASVSVAASGTYNVTVTINGCVSPIGNVNVVVEQTPATPTASSNSPVCTGNALTLSATTTSTMAVTWSWTGPISFTSSAQNPQVSPSATIAMGGTYNVTATASYPTSNLTCPSNAGSTVVVVNATPAISDTSITNPNNCATPTGSIVLNGLNNATTYEVHYDGPAGTVITSITSTNSGSITIGTLTAGTYSNVYVVSNNCPSRIAGPFTLVDPTPPPTPSATNNSAICDGESLQLNASTTQSGTATWSWTGPGGYSSNTQNPVINPATLTDAGTYNVTVTINNCTSSPGTTTVIVNPRPLAPVVSSPVVYCQYDVPAALTATALSGHTLNWYTTATGGTASATAPTPSTNNAGSVNYYVSQTTPESCEGPRSMITVTVNPTPVVANVTTTICSGASFNIAPTGTGVNATTVYSWSAPVVTGGLTGGLAATDAANLTGSLSNPTDFVQTATYTITPKTGNCPGNTFTLTVTVNPAPRVIFSIPDSAICSGATSAVVQLTSPTPNVNIPWTATVPAGISGVVTSGTNTIPAQTLINSTATPIVVTYAAVAINSGTFSCPGDTSRYFITVNPTPFIHDTAVVICSGQSFSITPVNSQPYNIVPANTTYTWQVSNNVNLTGQSDTTNPSASIIQQSLINATNTPQTLIYTVIPVSGAAGNCPGTSFTITVTVNPAPAFPTMYDVICSGQSFDTIPVNNPPFLVPVGTVYTWTVPTMPSGNGGQTSGGQAQTNQTHIFGTLTNTAFEPLNVTYSVVPSSANTTGSACAGLPFNYVVTVNPLASISNSPTNQSVCNNNATLPVDWTSFTAGSTYSWTLVSTGNVTGYLPAGAGPSLGTMTLTNNGIAQDSVVYAVSSTASACAGPATNYTIYVNPDAQAIFTYPYDTACWPYAVVINNNSPQSTGNINIPNSSYNWYTVDPSGVSTFIGTGTNFPGYTIPGPSDSVTIKMVAISAFGCLNDSFSHTFYTKPQPTAAFLMSNHDSCGPLTVSFTNQTNLIDTFQYQWNFGNGQTSTAVQPAPVTYLSSPVFYDTTYYITMIAYNECDTSTFIDSVIVRADPKALFSVSSTSGCSPFTIQIINSSLGNSYEYYWDFGNGDLDTTYANGSISYTYYTSVVDTFHLMLIAQNQCGRDTQIINIRVAPNIIVPGVTIDATELYGCVAHDVNFLNSTTGATSFTWDFGDLTSPLTTSIFQQIVPHTYNTAGTFQVTVNMTNGCSDTVVYKEVIVYPKPIAAFTTDQSLYCLGDTTHVDNTSQNATSYLWHWGNGQTGSGFEPPFVYNAPGTYTIQLEAQVTAPSGVVCYDTVSHPITVLSKPDSSIITNLNVANCSPYVMTASTPGVTNETVTWYVYDTTVAGYPIVLNGSTLQYTFNHAGTYTVEMIVENAAGCKDSTTRTFTVYQKPTAGFTPLNLTTCSLDTIVAYTNTTTANNYTPLTYQWFVDGIRMATTGNFNYHYITPPTVLLPRTFQTKLVATNSVGCADSITGLLQMNPTAKSVFSMANPNVCIPFVANITNNSTYATNYQWYLNGVLVSSAAAPQISITQANTNYTLTLIVSNQYACRADTSSFNFRSRVMPKAAFVLNNNLGCTGQLSVVTTNTSTNANSYQWEWGDATPVSTLFNPTHLYTNVGTYQILLTASDGQCTDTVSQYVVVANKPIANFYADQVISCDTARVRLINLTSNADSYQWYISNGYTTTDPSPTVVLPPSNTLYTVTLVAYNAAGCKDSLVKANYIRSIIPPPADFQIDPGPVQNIPNYSFSFMNLVPNDPKYSYTWSLGDGTYANTRDVLDHQYADTGSYQVQLIVLDNVTGCTDTIVKIARIEGYPGYLYVPNAFYPNSQEVRFRSFKPLGKGLAEYEMQIFDSWGKLLYSTNKLDWAGSPVEGWDGTFKGKQMPQDAYAWRIRAKYRNGREWSGMQYNNNENGAPGHTFGTLTLFR